MENLQKAVSFVNEVSKALTDNKVTTWEAFGLIPETVDFLSIFKNLSALQVEVELVEDKLSMLDEKDVPAYLATLGITTEQTRVYATVQVVFWLIQALKRKQ